MTYDEAISFWYSRINYEVRAAQPGDLKLERMRALLRLLGDPHERIRLVHVTGTKGKGSTCAMLASILQAAGYRVGLFTSPHLERVEERIEIDGHSISPTELAERMEEVAAAVRQLEKTGAHITFFEIGTALGFLHFWYRRCDIAVIEVGLGGRFDSTNVCQPLVSVITNIGIDHTAQLGDTLQQIAFQKAGIIKRGVPVVTGWIQESPRAVIQAVAAELNAPLRECQSIDERVLPQSLGLLGRHQLANATVALAASDVLCETGLRIVDSAITRGLSEVRWPARIELISQRPIVILDSAHNVPSIEALIETLRSTFPGVRKKHLIFAVSSDKHYLEMLRLLVCYFDEFYLTQYGNNPRCVAPDHLATVLAKAAPGTPSSLYATSALAWHAARSAAANDDLICVTGSVFLAGELRSILVTPES
jgi:dihydrofolate synthase/folylpolyglutamate synthase